MECLILEFLSRSFLFLSHIPGVLHPEVPYPGIFLSCIFFIPVCLILHFLILELTRAPYPGVLSHGFLNPGTPYPRVFDPVVSYPVVLHLKVPYCELPNPGGSYPDFSYPGVS